MAYTAEARRRILRLRRAPAPPRVVPSAVPGAVPPWEVPPEAIRSPDQPCRLGALPPDADRRCLGREGPDAALRLGADRPTGAFLVEEGLGWLRSCPPVAAAFWWG